MKKRIKGCLFTGLLSLTLVLSAGCGSKTESAGDSEGSTSVSTSGEAGAEAADTSAGSDSESSDTSGTAEETTYPLTITDDLGTEVTIEEEPERVVSLSPANTETLFAIGAGEKVVGRTDYCDYPEEAAEVESIGSYSSPNTELILSMTPDVVFASDYIDDSIRSQIEDTGAKVIVFAANDVDSVKKDIELAGQILNLNEGAQEVTETMTQEMDELQEILAGRTEDKSAFIDLGMYYSAGEGSLLGNMLDDIGVTNVAADTGEMWPQLSVEKIIEANPDVYISLYTTAEELQQTSGLQDMDCIKNGAIIYYEGTSQEASMIQRSGPRLVEGTRLLAEQIYPELFE